MYGTLRSALAARKIAFDVETFHGEATGRIVDDGGVLRIVEIAMHYRLRVPASQRAATDRALAAHPRGCPAHRSLEAAIPIPWTATIEEVS